MPMCGRSPRFVVRYIYGFIFLMTNIWAWVVRDYGKKALSHLPYLKICEGQHDCLSSEGVLRISLGCFIFFMFMFLTTVGTKKISDPRDSWHCGWWLIKGLLWIFLMIIPFFIPSKGVQVYGEIARLGAGVFLIFQVISIINFIYWWNEDWLSEKNIRRCYIPAIVTTALSYAAAMSGIILMYLWFAPRISCRLNIVFITFTLLMILLMTSISLHTKVNAGLLTSGLITLYIVFICWSAIMSEPASETCNTRAHQTGRRDWVTVISFILAVLVIVAATTTTGTDSECFRLKGGKPKAEDDVPYGYGFFHIVFATGAMYFAMLFVGWNLHQTMSKWRIDVGWASVWVKITNELIAFALYVWTMIAPLVFPGRDFI